MTCHQKNFTPYQREAVAKLKALLGNTPFSFEKNANNHMQVKIDGIDRVFHTGATPSDFRSLNNFLGDIKAEINRINTPEHTPEQPPKSQQKAQAKRQVCDFVEHQTQLQQKRLKRNLKQIRKQEFKMLTALQDRSEELLACDLLAERIGVFRRQQTAVELEQAIHKGKGDLFVTPGLIKSAKQELLDFLDQNLDTLAQYRDRLKQRRQRRVQQQKNRPSVAKSQAEPELRLPVSSVSPVSVTPDKPEAPETLHRNTGHNTASDNKQDTAGEALQTQAETLALPESEAKSETAAQTLTELMAAKKHIRFASLNQLSKQQLHQLMVDCQSTLEQKHKDDIGFLLQEMQSRGVEWHELEAAAGR